MEIENNGYVCKGCVGGGVSNDVLTVEINPTALSSKGGSCISCEESLTVDGACHQNRRCQAG